MQISKTFLLSLLCTGLLVSCVAKEAEPVYEPISVAARDQGMKLTVGLAHCGFCHGATSDPTAPLSGGQVWYDAFGPVTAANLTPTGIGDWDSKALIQVMRGGPRPDGTYPSQDMHKGYEWMSDNDLMPILSYLRTLPPSGEKYPLREVSFVDRNTVGFFDRAREVRGYVPALSKNHELEYGKYLVDDVAQCGRCHSLPASLFTDSQYLAGGQIIRNSKGDRLAPGLLPSTVNGIGDWNRKDLIRYMRTGMTPDKRAVDPDFCPTKFFALASEEDLELIAAYLKSITLQ